MSMKSLDDLRDRFCEELDEIARKGELGAGDLELAHKLTDTIKNIDKINMLEKNGYSRDSDWEARGNYGDGNSYANRGKHYVRGHYSRDRMRDERGRYSRDGYGGHGDIVDGLRGMMDIADEHERAALLHCIEQIEGK